ncbi:Hypp4820 [Branchiostoma lanceolatum]|uniref:Hypp4820 protein n=1 Tax=Branchiostoma lanceolatum TaxID=7740 RepID=A0A8K0F2V9_BRALA|nr:Hypp4820 [Branchiostoma lanceolatum]
MTNRTPERVIAIRPSRVLYTQQSVGGEFHNGTKLSELFRQILYEEVDIKRVPLIEVVRINRKMWCLDGNKRLRVFQELEHCGICEKVRMRYLSSKVLDRTGEKQLTTAGGRTVLVMDTEFDNQIKAIASEWRKMIKRSRSDVESGDSHETFDEESFQAVCFKYVMTISSLCLLLLFLYHLSLLIDQF